MSITVADVEAAVERIRPHVHRTPVLTSETLDPRLVLKAENLQRTGAFKVRGAFNALLQTDGDEVLTVSSGNHAQAVALAARELGKRAVVVMPSDANPTKVAATRAYGAAVIQHGVTADNREGFVRDLARERGLEVVHPFDDPRIMAGQGTCALELTEQTERCDAVVVPVGGGGLASGVATAIAARWPDAEVVGVEPEGADDARRSLEAGRRIPLDRAPDTICDGVRSLVVGEGPWTVIRERVHRIVTVPDAAVLRAMELLWTRTKTIVEPSGALGVAAVLEGRIGGGRLAVVLSGGNVDLDAWARYVGGERPNQRS